MERVDESAFQKPNVFQVVSKGYDEALQILYLAAQVNYTIVTSETHAIMQTVRILCGKKTTPAPTACMIHLCYTKVVAEPASKSLAAGNKKG